MKIPNSPHHHRYNHQQWSQLTTFFTLHYWTQLSESKVPHSRKPTLTQLWTMIKLIIGPTSFKKICVSVFKISILSILKVEKIHNPNFWPVQAEIQPTMLCFEMCATPSCLTCYHLVYQDYIRKTDWTNTFTIFHTELGLLSCLSRNNTLGKLKLENSSSYFYFLLNTM